MLQVMHKICIEIICVKINCSVCYNLSFFIFGLGALRAHSPRSGRKETAFKGQSPYNGVNEKLERAGILHYRLFRVVVLEGFKKCGQEALFLCIVAKPAA